MVKSPSNVEVPAFSPRLQLQIACFFLSLFTPPGPVKTKKSSKFTQLSHIHANTNKKKIMGSNGEEKPSFTPKIRQLAAIDSPKLSGTETPPLQTPVSVPFQWEEEPGKPRPCTALIILPSSNTEPKCLELPPRLFMESYTKVSKTPEPDEPYLERPKFSSFRYLSASPERGELNDMVLGKKWQKGKGFLDSLGLRTPTWKNEVDGGTSVFSSFSSCDSDESANTEVKIDKLRRKESFSSLPRTRSHTPLWATIYEGLKQVMPWKNRKSKKQIVNV